MKVIAIFLCLFPMILSGQILLDKEVFAEEMHVAFAQSVNGLEAFSKTEPVFLSCNRSEFFYEEEKGIWGVKLIFNCYSKEEALRTKELLSDEVEKVLPSKDFKRTKSYGAEYIDYLKWAFDFDSTTFAEKKKRPSIEIGVLKTTEDFQVVITLMEPYFKKQYSPSWD